MPHSHKDRVYGPELMLALTGEKEHAEQALENMVAQTYEALALRAVRDNYPKTLITLDDERPVDHEGIRQVYALDWLLDGNE